MYRTIKVNIYLVNNVKYSDKIVLDFWYRIEIYMTDIGIPLIICDIICKLLMLYKYS